MQLKLEVHRRESHETHCFGETRYGLDCAKLVQAKPKVSGVGRSRRHRALLLLVVAVVDFVTLRKLYHASLFRFLRR